MPSAELTLALAHLALLTPLAVLGLHKAWMIVLCLRARRRQTHLETATSSTRRLPKVTVQLPVFNERYVVERLIRTTADIDYPRDLLEIQVLDDSTDDTSEVIARCVASLPQDLRIRCLHRTDRRGYKAGALLHRRHGLQRRIDAAIELIGDRNFDSFCVSSQLLCQFIHKLHFGLPRCSFASRARAVLSSD